jgi:hypothetical protein
LSGLILRTQFRESTTTRLILKYLRERGMQEAFEAVQSATPSTSAVQLEHPSLTQLHDYLVKQGDFDAAENLLSDMAFQSDGPSLLDEYCSSAQPTAEWTRLDILPDVLTWDGEAPSPRGGHQMVLVRPNSNASSLRDDTDDIISIDLDVDDEAAIYLFGGWDGTSELSDFWRFSIKHQRWEVLHESQASSGMGEPVWPSARSCHQMCVDESTGDIYLLGKFTEASEAGVAESPVDPPSVPAESAPAAPDTESAGLGRGTGGRRAVGISPTTALTTTTPRLHPGVEAVASQPRFADFWVYHTRGPLAATWEKLSCAGGPEQMFDHQMVCDASGRKLYVFGGKYYRDREARYHGLYSYCFENKRWALMIKRFEPPEPLDIPPRTGHTMLLDPIERQLIIFGGQRGETYLTDLWTYPIGTGDVRCVDEAYGSSGGPDGGFTARAAMDTSRREFTLLSGLVRDRAPPHETTVKVGLLVCESAFLAEASRPRMLSGSIVYRQVRGGEWPATVKARRNQSPALPINSSMIPFGTSTTWVTPFSDTNSAYYSTYIAIRRQSCR